MIDQGRSTDALHPSELLLAYLEGTLPPEQQESVAAHLSTCPECKEELRQLKEALALLQECRNDLCPEVSELYEFVNFDVDEGGRIALHLSSCPLCRSEVHRLKPLDESHTMPEKTWRQAQKAMESPKIVVGPSRWFKPFVSGAVLAAASLAAAVCLMFLYPTWKNQFHQRVEPELQITMPTTPDIPVAAPRVIIALSSNAWDHKPLDSRLMAPRTHKADERVLARIVVDKSPTPKPKEPGEPQRRYEAPEQSRSRPVVAKVILLDNSSAPFLGLKLRFLYDCIEPDHAQRNRFEFLTPLQLQEAHQKGILSTESVDKFLEGLRGHFKASQMVFITLRSAGDNVDIDAKLLHVSTGNVLQEKKVTGVPQSQLALQLRELSRLPE
jgi:hypothetical protein